MLAIGRDRAIDRGLLQGIDWIAGDAESLPFADRSVRCLHDRLRLAQRHRISTRRWREARRVLKPGGRFLCLEFSHVAQPPLGRSTMLYSFELLPLLGQLVAGTTGIPIAIWSRASAAFRRSASWLAHDRGRRPRRRSTCRNLTRRHRGAPFRLAHLNAMLRALRTSVRACCASRRTLRAPRRAVSARSGAERRRRGACIVLRRAAVRAAAGDRSGRPGERLAAALQAAGAGLHQARPGAVDPRRSARRADRRRSLDAAGPAAAVSGRRGAGAPSSASSASRSRSCSRASTTSRSPPPRSPRCICADRPTDGPRRGRGQGAAARASRRPSRATSTCFCWLAELVERAQPRLRRLKPVEVVRDLRRHGADRDGSAAGGRGGRGAGGEFRRRPDLRVPPIDWRPHRAARADPGADRRHPDRRPRRHRGRRATIPTRCCEGGAESSSTRCSATASSMPTMHPGNMFVDAEGRIGAVDFGIMGRLDRGTRGSISPTCCWAFLQPRLSARGRGPFRCRLCAAATSRWTCFAQACRSIGEPIFGRPLPRDLVRPPARPAVPRHRAVRDGGAAAAAAAAEDHADGRGRRPPPQSRAQYLDPGAAADRGLDAGEPRAGGAAEGRPGDAVRASSAACPIWPTASSSWSPASAARACGSTPKAWPGRARDRAGAPSGPSGSPWRPWRRWSWLSSDRLAPA